ncbi:MAG: prepilin-type N-terminal cleavage/methylation domain-containing protein [Candidatus Taylorbacteria bacterium]|nr:prepilin-type N-terminal cleavage/methylation domain-containing protein [Candidatus Taylorbacteria bacterium]
MIKKKDLQNGFTLIETLIYVAIFSVFMVTIGMFATFIINSRLNNQIIFEINDQGNEAMGGITQSIRNATTVNSPGVSGTANSLSINTALASTTPTVFSLASGVLYIKEGTGSLVPLTNGEISVTNLIFSNLSQSLKPNTIQIRFTATDLATSTRLAGHFTSDFYGSASLRR